MGDVYLMGETARQLSTPQEATPHSTGPWARGVGGLEGIMACLGSKLGGLGGPKVLKPTQAAGLCVLRLRFDRLKIKVALKIKLHLRFARLVWSLATCRQGGLL